MFWKLFRQSEIERRNVFSASGQWQQMEWKKPEAPGRKRFGARLVWTDFENNVDVLNKQPLKRRVFKTVIFNQDSSCVSIHVKWNDADPEKLIE